MPDTPPENENCQVPPCRVFISYCRDDIETARRLYDDLNARGFTPWMDKVDILPGERWKAKITAAIKECDYFIALLSPKALSKKGYVQKELKKALDILDEYPDDEIFLLPVRIEPCSPENEILQDIHWADLFPSYDEGLQDILRTLNRSRPEADETAPPIPGPEPPETPEVQPGPKKGPEPVTPGKPETSPPKKDPPPKKPDDPGSSHHAYAAWIFGSILLVFYLWLFIDPNSIQPEKENMLAIISALLTGLFAFFLTGGLTVTVSISKGAKIGVQAAAGLGVFVLVLFWWRMGGPINGGTGPNPKTPQPVTSSIRIDTKPTGATIFVDGQKKGKAPVSLENMTQKSILVRVELDGYENLEQTVSLQPGNNPPETLTLKPPPPVPSSIRIDTKPTGATIFVDGQKKGKAPVSLDNMTQKSILVKAELDGYETLEQTFEIKSGETIKRRIVLAQIPIPAAPKTISGPHGMEFVLIKAGSFMMGSPKDEPGAQENEWPQHKVKITKDFFMQTTEVTQGQWKAVMGDNPSSFKECGDDCPVERVSWNDVQRFIERLNVRGGEKVYRLPTEAEWEYAARAGTTTPFAFGDCLSTDEANYDGNYPLQGCPEGEYRKKTIPVGSLKSNAWGLYDMHGNVWEWCQDWYKKDYYKESPVDDPQGPDSGEYRVIRGGYWYRNAAYCRSADRDGDTPEFRNSDLGFRLLRSSP